jgi:hypothetical protein
VVSVEQRRGVLQESGKLHPKPLWWGKARVGDEVSGARCHGIYARLWSTKAV